MTEPVVPSRIGFRKCSDIPDVEFLAAIDQCCDLCGPTGTGYPVTMATRWDVAAVLAGHPEDVGEAPRDYPGVPEKVVMAKARRLDRRGLISGCGCGCRGDFEITPKGRQVLLAARAVAPARDSPPSGPEPEKPWLGYILPPEAPGDPFAHAMLHGLPKSAEPAGATSTGLFSVLGGVVPVAPSALPRPGGDETSRVLDWALRTDEAVNGPPGRAQWAPADCICPWPWPTADGHVRLDCPRYKAPARPIVGRNPQIGCRKVDATWVHGRPHDCPKWMRG